MEHKTNIVLLNETNYATWKIQIKMYLIKEGLYEFVDGTATPPGADASAEQLSKYSIKKSRALAIIVLAIEAKLLYIVGDPVDPLVVWNKLRDTFQRKTWSNKLRLRRRLYGMKLKDGQNLQDHLREFTEIFDELAVIGDALEDEDKSH